MNKTDKRYLSRFECSWCNQPLHREECGAIYERCDATAIEKRRADCLAARRPRRVPAMPAERSAP